MATYGERAGSVVDALRRRPTELRGAPDDASRADARTSEEQTDGGKVAAGRETREHTNGQWSDARQRAEALAHGRPGE